uniref:Uncharacterized protein n=1 Tax=uncultured bacterium TB350_p TaxID=1552145 RepID=A0A0K0LBM8_9BACT|nr:hypothetical protein [uncultured bacterium TB350_p]
MVGHTLRGAAMIRKILIAAAAVALLGGCATGYGYSDGGYDAYGDYYRGYGGGSSVGYGGYGYGSGYYGGIGYYNAYGGNYGYGGGYGYGYPWYSRPSWYAWPGYGYHVDRPHRPHRPPGQGRPGNKLNPPPVGGPQRPGGSQARPRIQEGGLPARTRPLPPPTGRMTAPTGGNRAPVPRVREGLRPASEGNAGGRLRTLPAQPRPGVGARAPNRVAPPLARPPAPARVTPSARSMEPRSSPAPRAVAPARPQRASSDRGGRSRSETP